MTKSSISIIFLSEEFSMVEREKNKIVSELNNRAIAHIEADRYKEAIELLTKALSLDPYRAGILYNRAEAYRLAGNLEAARNDLLSMLKLTPNSAEALHGLGLIAYDNDDFSQAEEFYRRALHEDESYAPAWNDLGVIAFRMQRYEEARKDFEKATTIDPTFYDAWFNLADTYDELNMVAKRDFARDKMHRACGARSENSNIEEDD
jgi:tetratricopeptide (TPR) repeat protein